MLMLEKNVAVPAGTETLLRAVTDACLRLEGVEAACAQVTITTDEEIHVLNRQERGVDRPTDVLSFPTVDYPTGTARDNPKRVRREYDAECRCPFLGDIVISLERARVQAEEYGHSLMRELGFLTAHGMLHLLGYDHMQEDERAVMRRMEEAVMVEARLPRDVSDEALFANAVQAMECAYAPYSNYRVGACLLASDGRVFTGCNIENASYGATLCAERAAVSKAVSEGATRFSAIAVVGQLSDAWPCGVCRQVLNEFSDDMRVIVGRAGGDFTVTTLKALLPHSFGPDNLSAE